MPARLFTPVRLRDVTLVNRIIVSPMAQYSAVDGSASYWHLQHYGSLSLGGAGLVMLEGTAVETRGRATPGCLGLWSIAHEQALAAVLQACRSFARTPLGLQLTHAGRKASTRPPWDGGGPLAEPEGGWPAAGPSEIPFAPGQAAPRALDHAGMGRIRDAFAAAAGRAARLGIEVLELQAAHGHLLHQFLSPLANRRTDPFGGSLDNRLRFPLEVVGAVRRAWPVDRPLGVRLCASDRAEGGFTTEEAVIAVHALRAAGVDYVCASSGGLGPEEPASQPPGFQVPLAARLKAETSMPIVAAGLIVHPRQAEDVLRTEQADLVAIGRGFIDNPRWAWHAAQLLGQELAYPPQYARAHPALWSGAKVAHGAWEAAAPLSRRLSA
ncbi:MAG: NADH:flavin oxidoreductase/NADH oxidase [Dongiaceae bacterium]